MAKVPIVSKIIEHTDTLPATINADGKALLDYRVYGNTGGVGDKTVNYFDYRNYVYGYYISSSGVETEGMKEPWYEATWLNHSDYISISPNESYTMETHHQSMNGPQTVAIAWYDENKIFISRDSTIIPQKNAGSYSFTATAPQNAKFAIFNFFTDNVQKVMFTPGTTPPETFVPFGYVIPMNVRSLNIYNSAETSWSADGTILNDAGEPISLEGSHYTTNFIPVEPGEAYYLAGSLANETRWRVYFYDANKNWIRRTGSKSPRSTRLIAMEENASYFQLQVGTDIVSTSDWNFVHSRTAPEKYQPYYNTVTPIYIGDEPLEKDEYVDYTEQKVYRRTVNLFDYSAKNTSNGYIAGASLRYNGNIVANSSWEISEYIECKEQTNYVWRWTDVENPQQIYASICFYDENYNRISGEAYNQRGTIPVLTPQNARYIRVSYLNSEGVTLWNSMLTEGTTPPETYIPYLQPTDPPVTLPALSTLGNTNMMLDYDGTPAPSEMYIKYRGWSSRKDCAVKKYHISKNLYDGAVEQGGWSAMPVPGGSAEKYDIDIRCRIDKIVPVDSTTKYRATVFPNTLKIACFYFDEQGKVIGDTSWSEDNSNEIPIGSYSVVCTIKNQEETAIVPSDIQGIMITEGTDIPTEFDPYGKWWEDCIPRVLEVRTDTFTTLPATINVDRKVLLNYRIYGNTGGVGDEVDITELSAPLCGIDTYTDSLCLSTGILTRKIKKLVLTGQENWYNRSGDPPNVFFFELADVQCVNNYGLCTHYSNQESGGFNTFEDKHLLVRLAIDGSKTYIALRDSTYFATMSDFKSYIAQFYANGNPITVWYAIAEPEVSTITIPSGLTGTIEGYLIQDGTPTPQTPIYPTANGVKQADDTYSIKYSYKLDMGVKSTNIFNADIVCGSIRTKDGENLDNTTIRLTRLRSEFEDYMLPAGTYTISAHGVDEVSTRAYDSSKGYVYEASVADKWQKLPFTFTINNDYYMRFVFRRDDDSQIGVDDISNVMLNTTTSIYIGDEPLEKDEYVDYAEQKVYRRTANLFDKNATDTTNGYVSGAYIKSNGELQNSSAWFVSEYISVNAEEQYTVVYGSQASSRAICYYDINRNYISGANYSGLSTQETITTPVTCAYIRLSLVLDAEDVITVTPGTTPPETYIPYYRPTDPPIPLPEISTFSNTNTVLDYDGTPAPSFVVATYKGWFKHS